MQEISLFEIADEISGAGLAMMDYSKTLPQYFPHCSCRTRPYCSCQPNVLAVSACSSGPAAKTASENNWLERDAQQVGLGFSRDTDPPDKRR